MGGAGNDYIKGKDGNDVLFGNEGDDIISGGIGDDIIDGGAGADILHGGTGADTIIARPGNILFTGGDDDDSDDTLDIRGIVISHATLLNLVELIDINTLHKTDDGGIVYKFKDINTTLTIANQYGGSALAKNFEQIKVTAELADIIPNVDLSTGLVHIDGGPGEIYGTMYNDFITGSNEDDEIYSDGGNDVVNAGSGDDFIRLGRGKVEAFGQEGSDTFYLDNWGHVIDGGDHENEVDLVNTRLITHQYGLEIAPQTLTDLSGKITGYTNDDNGDYIFVFKEENFDLTFSVIDGNGKTRSIEMNNIEELLVQKGLGYDIADKLGLSHL